MWKIEKKKKSHRASAFEEDRDNAGMQRRMGFTVKDNELNKADVKISKLFEQRLCAVHENETKVVMGGAITMCENEHV